MKRGAKSVVVSTAQSSCMDLSREARANVARTVMYSAFYCPGTGGPGWGERSGLRLVHSGGLERPMTKSALAPRCSQAIVLVLAFGCLPRGEGSAVAVRRRDGGALGWRGGGLSTPQPPEAGAAGPAVPNFAPPAAMGPPSDGLRPGGARRVGLVLGHHRPGGAGGRWGHRG